MGQKNNGQEANYQQWVPFAASFVLALITAIVYSVTAETPGGMVYLQIFGCTLILLLFPLTNKLTMQQLPYEIGLCLTVHIFLAADLGTALNFYDRFAWWDLLMHGYFGFLGALVTATLLIRWNGEQLNRVGAVILVLLVVMGCGAIWEILEYFSDLCFNGDSQRVLESIALGKSLVADTMEDLMITFAGVLVFYSLLLIDKLSGYKMMRRLYRKSKA